MHIPRVNKGVNTRMHREGVDVLVECRGLERDREGVDVLVECRWLES